MAKKAKRTMPRAWAGSSVALEHKRNARRWTVPWARALVAALLATAIALGALLTVGHGHGRAALNRRVDREIEALLVGIPQEGRVLGSLNAPATLQVFGDLEDKDSRRWFALFLPSIIDQLVRTGALRIEYRSFKTNTIDPETFVKQQTAALAAGAQDRMWNFLYTFYLEQGKEYTPYVTEGYINRIASQVPGLNIAQWRRDRDGGRRSEQVVAEDQAAGREGVHVTPAYRLGRTGGRLRDFAGSEGVVFPRQLHRTTFASVKDIAEAIAQIH